MRWVISVILLSLFSLYAEVITADLEYQKITGVGYSWQTVTLGNSYSDAIVVCSNVLPDNNHYEAVVRIQNISSSSFELKIQRPNDSDPGYATDVYCIISDEGSFTSPLKYEAHKVTSDKTNGLSPPNNWTVDNAEDVTSSVTQSYTKPIVLGQVMSFNDANFSVFWSFDCDNRGNIPFASGMSDGICVGKHVGQIAEARDSEMLGYIVVEAGIYELEDFSMAVDRGTNSIKGIGNNPPYTYPLDKSYTDGVATKLAENGGQGGWAVLYGSAPFGTSLDMGIDEETVAGDSSRGHISEEVAYWVFLSDPITPAEMSINEVLYRQISTGTANEEFIEFYVKQGGNLKNYIMADQDGSAHHYRFPKQTVNTGDYVILHIGSGTDATLGNVHHFYMNRSAMLNNDGDDILLLRPSNTDTTIVDGDTLNVFPVDYIAYDVGTAIDSVPTSQLGTTISWDGTENSRLGGASQGKSISLTPNGNDSNTSACWELSATTVTSEKATNCDDYIPTRDTESSSSLTYSMGDNNNALPNMHITKSSIVTSDPVNGNSNPKRIPGATIRYCFTVDNDGEGSADSVTIKDVLSGNGRDNLTYSKSGYVIQDNASSCDCQEISDTSGTYDSASKEVSIDLGTIANQSAGGNSDRGCAYIEVAIK